MYICKCQEAGQEAGKVGLEPTFIVLENLLLIDLVL